MWPQSSKFPSGKQLTVAGGVGALVLAVSLGMAPQASAAVHGASFSPRLVLVGSAAKADGGWISLTNDTDAQAAGAAWSRFELNVTDGFVAAFAFRMTPAAEIGAPSCDGLAFVVQDDTRGASALGQAGGEMGFGSDPVGAPSRFGVGHSVAVKFDTCQNQAVQFGRPGSLDDPSSNYVSVMTRGSGPNSADEQFSLGHTPQLANFRDGNVHHVTVRYASNRLSVELDGAGVLSVPIALATRLGLPADGKARIGLTAGTGDFVQAHQFKALTFKAGG
jgi:hypothetical protein